MNRIAGRVLFRLFEHVAHAAGADADEHLDEIRTRNGEERHACLTRNGAGQQRLAGTRRADQQRAFRNLAPELGEALRVLEELDDFLKLFACFIDPRDIVEGDLALSFGKQLGLGLAEAHRAARTAALLHLSQRKEGNAEDQHERQDLDKRIEQQIAAFRLRTRIADSGCPRAVAAAWCHWSPGWSRTARRSSFRRQSTFPISAHWQPNLQQPCRGNRNKGSARHCRSIRRRTATRPSAAQGKCHPRSSGS